VSQAVNSSLNDFLTSSIGTITVGRLFQAVVALVVCAFLARFVVRYADRALTRIHVERSLHTFVKSALNILLYTVAALIAADSLGIPITSLVALVGVVGLAVSLSVQNTLMNLMGGLLILTTKPFIVGDYVKAGDAEGTVVDIGLPTCSSGSMPCAAMPAKTARASAVLKRDRAKPEALRSACKPKPTRSNGAAGTRSWLSR